MRAIASHFFKDESGRWHQPGSTVILPEDELRRAEEKGVLRVIRTQMEEGPPEVRRGRRRANAVS